MRFIPFIPLTATVLATAISENLFSENSPDTLAFQDSPQDLIASQDELALQDLSDGSELTIGDDDDLFAGADAMDTFSTEPQDSSFGLEASCLIDEGQSLNKLRSRDGPVCSPEGPAPLQKDPTQDKIGDIFRKIKEFFDYPPDDDPTRPRGPTFFRICRRDFPLRLCCVTPGLSSMDITIPGGLLYEYYYGCYPGS